MRLLSILTALPLAAALAGAAAPTVGPAADRPVVGCPPPAAGRMACAVEAQPLAAGRPPAGLGYTPAQLRRAYRLPGWTSSRQTVAIVVAYHDPAVVSDLAAASVALREPVLPRCAGTRRPCIRVTGESGNALPRAHDQGWTFEETMDTQTVHGICLNCSILVVEARSNSSADLARATRRAVALGAHVVSLSFGSAARDSRALPARIAGAYRLPHVVYVAAAGDAGAAAGEWFPAELANVVAVGGTTLRLGAGGAVRSETVWSGTQSGCALGDYPVPRYQRRLLHWRLGGCRTEDPLTGATIASRGANDIAADAAYQTGMDVYLSAGYHGHRGWWWRAGGTSLATPLIAAAYALAGNAARLGAGAPARLYAELGSRNLRDITAGANGSCPHRVRCHALPGWDMPTGVGVPRGVTAF